MKKIIRTLLIAIGLTFYCLLLPQLGLYAQSNCSELLQEAQEHFENGKPELISGSLNDCLQKVFTRQEKIQAYKLMTIAYLMEKDDSSAANTFRKLLSIDPEFKIDTSQLTDPAELVFLYESFRTDPIFHINAQLGTNIMPVKMTHSYNADINVNDQGAYILQSGYQAGLMVSLPLVNRNVSIQTGAWYYFGEYNYSRKLETSTSLDNFAELTFTETHQILQAPLLIRYDIDLNSTYNFNRRKVVPYFQGGIVYNHLIRANLNEISRLNSIGASVIGVIEEEADLTDKRNTSQLAWQTGTGIKVKLGLNYLMFDLRYTQEFSNAVVVDKRYENSDLLYRLGHVDDDFKLSYLAFSIGLEIPIYRPRPLH